MPAILTYQDSEPQLTRPQGTFIGDESAGSAQLADKALHYAQTQAEVEATRTGAEDQAAAGTTPLPVDTGLLGMPTTFSQAYNKAARLAYVEQKKSQLENTTAQLQLENQYDPVAFQAKLGEFRQ